VRDLRPQVVLAALEIAKQFPTLGISLGDQRPHVRGKIREYLPPRNTCSEPWLRPHHRRGECPAGVDHGSAHPTFPGLGGRSDTDCRECAS